MAKRRRIIRPTNESLALRIIINEDKYMQTIICKHDDRGGFEVLGTDGQPVRIILVEDDHMDAANITVNGDRHLIANEFVAESKPDMVSNAMLTYTPFEG